MKSSILEIVGIKKALRKSLILIKLEIEKTIRPLKRFLQGDGVRWIPPKINKNVVKELKKSKSMTPEQRAEIRNEINESLQLGIPIPTIAANLKENGIDIFEFFQHEEQVEKASQSEVELAETALKKAQTQFKTVQIVSLLLVIPLLGFCFNSPVRGLLVLSTMIFSWTARAKQVKELDARLEDLSSQVRLAALESQ